MKVKKALNHDRLKSLFSTLPNIFLNSMLCHTIKWLFMLTRPCILDPTLYSKNMREYPYLSKYKKNVTLFSSANCHFYRKIAAYRMTCKRNSNESFSVFQDPHYYSQTSGTVTREDLQTAGWVSWKLVEDFDQQSFYNLCLPQLKAKQRS